MSYLTIRQIDMKDLPTILKLYRHLSMDGNEPEINIEEAEVILNRIQTYPFYYVYLVFLEDKPAGTFSLIIIDNLAHGGKPFAILENVVVEEGYRGLGIGTFMVRYAMKIAQDAGCYKLALSSNRYREKAHKLYHKLGFTIHGYSYELPLSQ